MFIRAGSASRKARPSLGPSSQGQIDVDSNRLVIKFGPPVWWRPFGSHDGRIHYTRFVPQPNLEHLGIGERDGLTAVSIAGGMSLIATWCTMARTKSTANTAAEISLLISTYLTIC